MSPGGAERPTPAPSPPGRLFWRAAAVLALAAALGYGAVKVRQVEAAFAAWEGQAVGPAPGAADR